MPLKKFSSASITFTGNYIRQFDQAGLLLTMTHPDAERKWIKTGVEFFNGQPRLSTVCTDNWSDWSVAPAPSPDDVQHGKKSITIEVKKTPNVDGSFPSVWVYAIDGDKRTELREIAWVYAQEGGKDWDLEIAAMAARPNKEAQDSFHAQFSAVEIEEDDSC